MQTADRDELSFFGERVRHFRVERGLTQSELADKVDLDRKTINRLEAGHYSTSLRNVFRIAAALSIVPGHLFSDDRGNEQLLSLSDDGSESSAAGA